MIYEIPLSAPIDQDDFTVNVELDGNTYLLGFSYSANVDRWYFDCSILRPATDPVLLVSGVACCALYLLLAGVTHVDRPRGELQFHAKADPGRDDLGTRARLYYRDAAGLGRV